MKIEVILVDMNVQKAKGMYIFGENIRLFQ